MKLACLTIGVFLLITSCNSVEKKKSEFNTQGIPESAVNAPGWVGQYEGTLPCADCPGIITVLELKPDTTFTMYNKYIDRDVELNDKGPFIWEQNESVIYLKGNTTDIKYSITPDKLIQLDLEGNALEGPFKDAFNLTKHGQH